MKMYCWSSRSRIFRDECCSTTKCSQWIHCDFCRSPSFLMRRSRTAKRMNLAGWVPENALLFICFPFSFCWPPSEAWPESQNAVWPWMYKKQRCCFFPFQKGSFDKAKGTKHRSKQLMNVCGQNRHAVKFACCPVWYDLTRRQILVIWWIKAGYHWTCSLCECWARFTSSQRSTSAVNILPLKLPRSYKK